MQNILIISNDSRIPSLVDYFQPLLRGQISSVSDFDLGLKEVFDKRPVAVFVQSEIAGISGDAVAKHIKGLLRDDSPRLVLLRDAPDRPLASRHAFDDSIDLFLPLEEVTKLTRSQLEKIAGLEMLEPSAAPSAPPSAPESAVPAAEKPAPAAAAQPAPPVSAPQRPAAPKPPTPPAATATAAAPDAARKEERSALPKAAPSASPQESTAAAKGAVPQPMPAIETSIFETEFKARPTTSRIWLYLCVVLALLLGGAFVFAPRWFGLKKPSAPVAKPSPAPAAAPSPVTAPAARQLPSVVPLNGRDAAYAAARPGWDRYLSPTLEFLVFREQGRLKAIQVIGRDGGSVPEETIAALLREAFQSEGFTAKGSTEQDGYQVEEGIIPGKGEVLVYRRKGPGTVRAVVVTWS